jgi:ribonuclease G
MTRQNVTDGVREIMTKPCPVCSGEGVVKSEETIAIEFGRHMRHMAIEAGDSGPEAYLLRVNPKVTAWFIADGARELHAIEQETGRYFHFEGSDGLPLDHFAVTMEGTRAEIEEHAVPFRAGEEVHVTLVEPHMYNDDDAVAKVDGYLIDVVNGIAFVGEKKLVRIEEAGRTIARAVLTGADAEAAEEAAKDRVAARERTIQAARRSAAAKRGASKRREATATLADETPTEASTAPGVVEEADGSPRKRSRRRRRSEDPDAADVVAATPVVEEAEEAPAPKPKGRVRKRPAAAAEEPAEPAPKPAGRVRKRAAAAQAADEAVEAGEVVVTEEAEPEARPARKRRAKPKPEPEPEPEAVDEDDEESEDDDALSSRPRRRGRRGGRRRSRAATPADSD